MLIPRGELRFGSAAGRWVVAASVLGSGIAAIDATVVGVALPAIGREFQIGVEALQWVVSGYFLTLASFLLLSGSLSDRFGRKRLFGIGVIGFAVASAACGLARVLGSLSLSRVARDRWCPPGHWEPRHPRGVVCSERPGRGDRSVGRSRCGGHCGRTAAGRLSDLGGFVALDLLPQRSRRCGRALRRGPPRSRVKRSFRGASHRRGRRKFGRRRARRGRPADRRAWARVVLHRGRRRPSVGDRGLGDSPWSNSGARSPCSLWECFASASSARPTRSHS